MSDRAALYAAVCADPDDDTARLVFADWLEEHGEGRRAAFVRAKVDRHRRETADTPAAWVYRFLDGVDCLNTDLVDWSKVDPELAGLYEAGRATRRPRVSVGAKSEGLPRLKGIRFEGDERGFVGAVHAANGRDFVDHAGAIFKAAPVTDVTFGHLDADSARDLAARGHLARLRAIDLWEMEDAGPLEILGTHPDAAGVRVLYVSEMEAQPADLADALIAGKHWTGLRKLTLSGMADGDEPMDAEQGARLFRKPAFSGLRELVVWDNGFEDADARAIASGGMPELRCLDLGTNAITGDGAGAIARAKGLPSLRYLDLSLNDVGDGAATAALVNSAGFPALVVLKLGGRSVAYPDPKVLARPGRGPTLRALELPEGDPTPAGSAALGACPAVRGLWCLSAEGGDLASAHVVSLLRSAEFGALALLNLGYNRLTMTAARAIAKWRGAASLQWLGLAGNPFDSDAHAALADSPHLSGLKHISASGPATSPGMRKLMKRFGKKLMRTM